MFAPEHNTADSVVGAAKLRTETWRSAVVKCVVVDGVNPPVTIILEVGVKAADVDSRAI